MGPFCDRFSIYLINYVAFNLDLRSMFKKKKKKYQGNKLSTSESISEGHIDTYFFFLLLTRKTVLCVLEATITLEFNSTGWIKEGKNLPKKQNKTKNLWL